MEDYVTLNEIYIHDSKLFKTKNLKSFVKNHKISENDMVMKGSKILGIKKNWIKKNIPSLNLKLEEFDNNNYFFEVLPVLEKYIPKIKNFNPTAFNLDTTTIKYFMKDGVRTPYFTRKGYVKIKIFFNDFDNHGYEWLYELMNGVFQSQISNLDNIKEMVALNHAPIVKVVDGNMMISNHVFDINKDDIVVDFKRVGELKKETNLKQVIEAYKCPLYSQLQTTFVKSLKEVEDSFNAKIKELTHERVIQHLQQELDKEKCLKDQVLSLTQSFIPMSVLNGEIKPSPSMSLCTSPFKSLDKNPSFGKLKPSKIQ